MVSAVSLCRKHGHARSFDPSGRACRRSFVPECTWPRSLAEAQSCDIRPINAPLNSPLANPCNWDCARKGIGCTAPRAAQSSSIPSTSASGIPAFRLLSGATTARAGRLMSHSALLDGDWSTTPCLQPQRRPTLLFPSHLVAPPRGRTKAGARLRVPPACAVAVCLPRAAAARPCCRWLCWLVLPSAHCKPKLVAARNG